MAEGSIELSVQRIHRFRISEVLSWETLQAQVRRFVGSAEDVVLRYRAEAGDTAVVSSQSDWDECLYLASILGIDPLCLTANLSSAGLSQQTQGELFARSTPLLDPTAMPEEAVAPWGEEWQHLEAENLRLSTEVAQLKEAAAVREEELRHWGEVNAQLKDKVAQLKDAAAAQGNESRGIEEERPTPADEAAESTEAAAARENRYRRLSEEAEPPSDDVAESTEAPAAPENDHRRLEEANLPSSDDVAESTTHNVLAAPRPLGCGSVYARLKGTRANIAFNVENIRRLDPQLKIVQKVRGILNRITKRTYDPLTAEMWHVLSIMKLPEPLDLVVDTIFEMAVTQTIFSALFADICVFLCNNIKSTLQQQQEAEGLEAPAASPLQKFRHLLLNKCQTMFELSYSHRACKIPDDLPKEKRVALQNEEDAFRSRSLANTTFVAQLFNRSLLSERIMHTHLIHRLIEKDHTDFCSTWVLELLLTLLQLTGKKLDRIKIRDVMDRYFFRLEQVAKLHPDTRMRHLTFNLVEMRHVGWQTREQAKASGDAFSLSTRRLAAEWAAAQMASQRTAGVPAPARRKAAPASKIAPKPTARSVPVAQAPDSGLNP